MIKVIKLHNKIIYIKILKNYIKNSEKNFYQGYIVNYLKYKEDEIKIHLNKYSFIYFLHS